MYSGLLVSVKGDLMAVKVCSPLPIRINNTSRRKYWVCKNAQDSLMTKQNGGLK